MPFDSTPAEITVDTPASLILEAAIKLIEQPEHWCRGTPVMFFIHHPSVAYCAWGSARRAAGGGPGGAVTDEELELSDDFTRAVGALDAIAKVCGYPDIARLNDDPRTTHAMVLAVMREAVEITRDRH